MVNLQQDLTIIVKLLIVSLVLVLHLVMVLLYVIVCLIIILLQHLGAEYVHEWLKIVSHVTQKKV